MPIFDQGYQHWQGELSGHGWRWLAVTRHGVRSLLKSWIVRILLLVAWLPALALVGFLTLWGLLEQQAQSVISFLQALLPPEMIAQPQECRAAVWTIAYSYFFKAELLCSLFLVLVVGPHRKLPEGPRVLRHLARRPPEVLGELRKTASGE